MAQLLENTLMGGALILAAAGLRRLLRGRIHPNGWLVLWAVCLARLLTPVPWRTPLSLYALLGRPAGAAEPASALFEPAVVPFEPAAVPGPAVASLPAPRSHPAGPFPLAALWAAAALGLAVWFLAAWLSARRGVRQTIPLEKSDRRYAAMPAGTALREGPMKGAPLTFGVVRPAVVLPPGLKAPELDCVLAHEGAHVRRRDNLWHYAMAAALILHWFNPAVWLMAGLLRRDVEMACDRAALRELGTERRAEYAQTLVTLSTQAGGPAFCHGFGPKKRAEERIIAIMKFKKATFAGTALVLALMLGLTVVFASSPTEEPNGSSEQVSPQSDNYSIVQISDPSAGESVVSVSQDELNEVLRHIEQFLCDEKSVPDLSAYAEQFNREFGGKLPEGGDKQLRVEAVSKCELEVWGPGHDGNDTRLAGVTVNPDLTVNSDDLPPIDDTVPPAETLWTIWFAEDMDQ